MQAVATHPRDAELRRLISADFRTDEAAFVHRLVTRWQALAPPLAPIQERAAALIAAVRAQRAKASGVDHLMQEFSLSSQEGVALMCLAEALLRIPDSATADRLIRDKLAHGNWKSHLGGSPSLFVNAATWGLMITGKLAATHSAEGLGNALTRLIAKSGEPVIRAGVDFAMRLLGQQFVMGETIERALERSADNEARGYAHSFDMLGEAALTAADADRYLESYRLAIEAVGKAAATRRRGSDGQSYVGISIKLSALHPRYVRAQRERVMKEMLPRLLSLLEVAREFDIGVNIDAEESERLDLSLDLFAALAAAPSLAGWEGLGFVVQAYQKRAPAVIDYLTELARHYGRRFPVRLVKGAYWDSEIKRAQVEGQSGYPVFTRKPYSDLCYMVCAQALLAAPDAFYPQFATHNAYTLAVVEALAQAAGNTDYEFQCLHGMGEPLYDNVVAGRCCRIYAPVGSHETLLPYLVRRLLENGANSSFVNRIVDPAVVIDELLVDPLQEALDFGCMPHPRIPLPADLFGAGADARRNSRGFDFSSEPALAEFEQALAQLGPRHWSARPQIHYPAQEAAHDAKVGVGETAIHSETLTSINPANDEDVVGVVHSASAAEIDAALASAHAYADEWFAVPAARRAAMLEASADLLERHTMELVSLCIREAGKSWPNAIAEIREAVDFCRYYAQQARRLPSADKPPGVALCISPWNFPLAIFLGQVTAALAAGSPVIAKPAEQTALIAAHAVDLLHRAGVPLAALQCLPGRGESVGARLVADARVRSVIFTGSTEVAQLINRQLAARGGAVKLIAETGGQNAMIVDSTALLEQVVHDTLSSGFDSAGQRCSALRVLCVQDEVAERLLEMLCEAMRELRVGDPGHLATDIGPVIDAEARAGIEAHVARLQRHGAPVHRLPLPAECARGTFVAPTVIELASIAELDREIFGPVIHFVRYRASDLDELVECINATGYGLTLGVHSRIDETVTRVCAAAQVGNIYVNRNIVGAVVGVQPFGGEGKSGTGPKAGGPYYVPRLAGLATVDDSVLQAAAVAHEADGAWLLPGPTGERNTWRCVPRGQVLCLADTAAAAEAQIATVRAAGCQPLALERLRNAMGNPAGVEWIAEGAVDTTALGGVLCALLSAEVDLWRRRLAARGGALVRLIEADASGRYPGYRLQAERVVSVNTTAAGGNTALMTLES
jgi:RHH-type proline utilization regulon transcriptional repressor/proline dehydrogenase/delta 1-pyrroline-5-carboxylate dehydrogenase